MLKSLIRLILQKVFCPISLEALEVYHSSESINTVLGEGGLYVIMFAVLAIAIRLIEISRNARWLHPMEPSQEKELYYLGIAISVVGLGSNVVAYYHIHAGQPQTYQYWVGFFDIFIILFCYERLVKFIGNLRLIRKLIK